MRTNFETDIYEQPRVIRQLIKEKGEEFFRLAEKIRLLSPAYVLIAARGTSDNAAIYGKYLFSGINRVPVGLAIPSLYTLYSQAPDMSGGMVIGISQSGQTPDVLAVLEEARRQKVYSISITNEMDSPMARAADSAVYLNAGKEISVPASKTYTAQLTALAALSAFWRGDEAMIGSLQLLGDLAEQVLDTHPMVKKIAARFAAKEYLAVVGRGFNYCTTFEIALKIKEISYMVTQGYSAADFRHGPIAMLDAGFPVIALSEKGKAEKDMAGMISEICQTGADLSIFSNDDALLSLTDMPVKLPDEMPDWLSPVITTIPGQLLALHLCLQKGHNPDQPRGLSKITLTY